MKTIYSLLAIILFTTMGYSQDALYVKYKADISNKGEDNEMIALMMDGSSMEIASDDKMSWVRTDMGTMMTMTIEMDNKEENMTMLITSLVGTMAFQGNPKEISDEEEDEIALDIQFENETKNILGYKCKKAIQTDDKGNKQVFWYTKKFKRPQAADQMPDQIPGLCLQMEIAVQEGLSMTYTASELKVNIDMDDYKVEIPDGIEIKSLKEMGDL